MSTPELINAAISTGIPDSELFNTVEQIPFPQIQPNEILVKAVAYGANPTDWRHTEFGLGKTIAGSDASGVIHAVGSDVKGFEVGDIVAAHTHGNFDMRYGFFADYFIAVPEGTLKFAPENFKELQVFPEGVTAPSKLDNFEAIASAPLCLGTVGYSFSRNLGIKADKNVNKDKYLLIWGGATSVGVFGIQIARKVYGINVITTASAKHHKFLKELGAEAVFDYHDADVVEQIKKHAKGRIVYALDAVSTEYTFQQTYDATIGSSTVAIDNLLLMGPEKLTLAADDQRSIDFTQTIVYLAFGKDLVFPFLAVKADADGTELYNRFWNELLPPHLGEIVTPNLLVLKAGLASANKAVLLLYKLATSCEKIVWRAE